ncbi:hypothetical protein [Cupriavidus campinensis]
MTEKLVSPTTGKTLIRVGVRTTTLARYDEPKLIPIQREFIEVVVFDSKLISRGSQWGHAAIEIDGTVYSRAPTSFFRSGYRKYLIDNTAPTRTLANGEVVPHVRNRGATGLLMWMSSREKKLIQDELERRVAENKKYSLFSNSCSTNVADVLELAGIMARDPRAYGEFTPVTPAELLSVLKKSNRLVEIRNYKKGWEGGASANW